MIDNHQPIYHHLDLGRAASQTETLVVDRFGLRLQVKADGPLGLVSADGSLGRRLLPRGFTVDPSLRCYFVDPATGIIWRYDSSETPHDPRRPFEPVIDFATSQVRMGSHTASRDWSLAANRELLMVLSPGCGEVITFSLKHLAIAHRQSFRRGQLPIDLVASAEDAYLLTERAVYTWNVGDNCWRQILAKLPQGPGSVKRLLLDKNRHLWGFDGQDKFFKVVATKRGRSWENAPLDRDQLDVPPVYTLHTQANQPRQFVIPAELTSACDRRMPAFAQHLPPELCFSPISGTRQSNDLSSGFIIDQQGQRITTPMAYLPRKQSLVSGSHDKVGDYWISPSIDSQLYACLWDVVELYLPELPPTARVEVATFTSDDEAARISYDSALWDEGIIIDSLDRTKQDDNYMVDFPVHSRPGRYLWLRIRLSGDGFQTPLISRIFCRAPRQSYTDFLPAVMQEDNASHDFLDRFLAVFQVSWDALDEQIENMDHLFDAQKAPANQLSRLATSLGLPLRAEWNEAQRRTFLQSSRDFLVAEEDAQLALPAGVARGTAAHLKHYLQAILAAVTGLDVQDLQGFPWIIEGFRRRGLQPVRGHRDDFPQDSMLRLVDSPSAVASLPADESRERMRLGQGSRLGHQRLLAPNPKQLEPYACHAHRFEVVLPACWVADRKALFALEDAVESEKPAHTIGKLTLIQPGLCIGLQSTLGVDTILADRPEPVLGQDSSSYLGLGQGLILPGHDSQPPPLQLDTHLATHRL